MDGIAATAVLRESIPQSSVILLTIYDNVSTRSRAQVAGAAAFVHKSGDIEGLLATIRHAAEQKKN